MSFMFNRSQDKASFDNLTVPEYRERFFDGEADHVLVDVRTQSEYTQGHLPGAINIPLDSLPVNVGQIPKGKPVVVVCASGNRSRTGSSLIAQAGYDTVYNLKGGTMVWMMHRYPLE